MEIQNLFGDGSSVGNISRAACLHQASAVGGVCSVCGHSVQECGSSESPHEAEILVEVAESADSLPREIVVEAVQLGRDLRLQFVNGATKPDSLLRETAFVVRHLRTAGLTVSLAGLSSSERARLSRHETSIASL